MKKIVLITPYMSGTGGTETVLKTLLRKLPESFNLDVSLVVLGSSENKRWLKNISSQVKVDVSSNKLFSRLLVLYNQVLKEKPAVVVCLSTKILDLMHIIRSVFRLDYKLVSWIHFSINNEISVNPKKLRLADYNLAISTGIMHQLINQGIDRNKISLIYNPVDYTKKVIPNSSSTKIHLGYVGRIMLNGQKNLKELFDSLKIISPESVKVDFWGTGDVKECQKYIDDNDIQQEFEWHGWVESPWNKIHDLDAIVLTSKFEGFPMVLLESISYGVPVISADCPTGPSDIVNSKNGYLYLSGSTHELAHKIINLKSKKYSRDTVKHSIDAYYTENYIEKFWTNVTSLN